MMWLVIIIIVFILVAFLIYKESATPRNSGDAGNIHLVMSGDSRFSKVIDAEDIQYKIDEAQRKLEKKIEESKASVDEAKRKGYITVDISWMNHFDEMVEISNTLNQNLIHENKRLLKQDKFHRYTSLHYRSMIMGDLAYEDYKAARAGRDEIGDVLVKIGKGQIRVSRNEKANLYQVKDAFKDSTKFLLDRTKEINHETARLRDKIGDECGARGRKWREERMNHN